MKKTAVFSKKGAKPAGPYSPAIMSDGFLFVSGQTGLNPQGELVGTDIETQTKQTFRNIEAILTEAACSVDDVVKVTIYLTNISDFSTVNDLYKDWVTIPYPARATIGVASLPLGALIEIECVAKLN